MFRPVRARSWPCARVEALPFPLKFFIVGEAGVHEVALLFLRERAEVFVFDVTRANVFLGASYFFMAKSSTSKIWRISITSPGSAGQRCAHFTSSSLDPASTIQ